MADGKDEPVVAIVDTINPIAYRPGFGIQRMNDFPGPWLQLDSAAALPYDVIGQSYYPWRHGTLLDLRENLIFMANEYRKDIILVAISTTGRSGLPAGAVSAAPARVAENNKPRHKAFWKAAVLSVLPSPFAPNSRAR